MKALVVEVPALHLGYLGCYGNEWVATPALDRLAAQGVVFDQHYADCCGSFPSPRTGRYHIPGPPGGAAPAAGADLKALFDAHGIPFVEVPPAPGPPQPGEDPATPLERTLEAGVAALDGLPSVAPWLLWITLPSLAPPWQLPENFLLRYFAADAEDETEEDEGPPLPLPAPPVGPVDREDFALWERVQLTFAGAVSYLDAGLGLLVDELHRRSLLDDLLLVVTAQRGLALGEHGIVGDCRPWLHDEVIHLPLIVRLPDGAEAGRRISALSQPVDLFPTLVEAFHLPAGEAQGHSLWPLARGTAELVRPYACAGWEAGGAVEWALRAPGWAFLLPVAGVPDDAPRGPQLYVKPDDRWEVNDVRQHHLEMVEHLENVLRAFVAAARQPGALRVPELRDVEAEPAGQAAGGGPAIQPEGD